MRASFKCCNFSCELIIYWCVSLSCASVVRLSSNRVTTVGKYLDHQTDILEILECTIGRLMDT